MNRPRLSAVLATVAFLSALFGIGPAMATRAAWRDRIERAEQQEAGSPEQARSEYLAIIAASDPEAEAFKPRARLGVVRLTLPAPSGGWGSIGIQGATKEQFERAQTALEQAGGADLVATDPERAAVRTAALWLGLLLLEPENSQYDASKGTEQLRQLVTSDPDSLEACVARTWLARLALDDGDLDSARGFAFRALSLVPEGPHAALAWMTLAEANWRDTQLQLEERAIRALQELGRAQAAAAARSLDEYRARALAGLVDGLRFRAKVAPQPIAEAALEHAPDAMVVDAAGVIWILADEVLLSAHAGEIATSRRPLEGARSLAFDAWNRMWWLAKDRLRLGDNSTLTVPEGVKPSALAPVGARLVWTIDREDSVVLFGGDGTPNIVARLPDRQKPLAIVPSYRRGVWVLAERPFGLVEIDAKGAVLQAVDLVKELGKEAPVGLARDPLGNLYVLGEEGRVLVLPHDAEAAKAPLRSFRITGEAGRSPEAELFVVDPTGAIVVVEERGERRLRWWR